MFCNNWGFGLGRGGGAFNMQYPVVLKKKKSDAQSIPILEYLVSNQ